MTITVTVHGKIQDGQKEKLSSFLEANLPNTRSAPGCRLVEVFFDLDETELVLNEEWLTTEDHQQYISKISDAGAYEELLGFFTEEPAVRYLKKTTL